MSNPNSIPDVVREIQSKHEVVGRAADLRKLVAAWRAGKHVLVEGEVGVGKTRVAKAVAEYFNPSFFRVDGSEDLLPHALVGYFDPPTVVREGYVKDAFVEGPLTRAMREGGCLFVNEINRMPENTQNVLLTSLDEGTLDLPRLGTLKAKPGFWVVATQNPAAHVGVTALGEALKDRFVWIKLDHQSEPEETQITLQEAGLDPRREEDRLVASVAVRVVRRTRHHPEVQRGASVRAAIDAAKLFAQLSNGSDPRQAVDAWVEAAVMAVSTKLELEDGVERRPDAIVAEIVEEVLSSPAHPW
ncbi:MAG: CbbQ/NirQ/NorQ/GpvN family protein [Promethearchaeota archaeon]